MYPISKLTLPEKKFLPRELFTKETLIKLLMQSLLCFLKTLFDCMKVAGLTKINVGDMIIYLYLELFSYLV